MLNGMLLLRVFWMKETTSSCSTVDRMYATAMSAIAPSAVVENHIKTNSMGLPGAIQGTSLW